MTDLQILTAVKNNNGTISYIDLLNLNLSDAYRDPSADKARIDQMIKDGFLEGRTDAYCQISITKPGRLRLQNAYYLEEQNKKIADEAAKSKAEQERQNRFLRFTTIISLAIAIISVIASFISIFVK